MWATARYMYIVSFIGLFCKRDLYFWGAYYPGSCGRQRGTCIYIRIHHVYMYVYTYICTRGPHDVQIACIGMYIRIYVQGGRASTWFAANEPLCTGLVGGKCMCRTIGGKYMFWPHAVAYAEADACFMHTYSRAKGAMCVLRAQMAAHCCKRHTLAHLQVCVWVFESM